MGKEQSPASSLEQEKDAAFRRLELSTAGAVLGTLGTCAWPLLALPAIGCWVVSVRSLDKVLSLEKQMSVGKSA